MNSQDLKKKQLPDSPGVYKFLGKGKKLLYIGKATSLRDRVRSYFNSGILKTRGPLIEQMVGLAKFVEFIKTDSVLEAMILEVNLIKKHKPKFNTKEKDDKSFSYVVVTKEDFPRVLLVRGKELLGSEASKWIIKYAFGPFPKASSLKQGLKIIRKIFPFRDKCKPSQSGGSGKPCFNNQIGLCSGICAGLISKKDYGKIIQNLKLFFDGKKKSLVKKLEKEMKMLAKDRKFEKAGEIKKTIFALNHIQDVALVGREEDRDSFKSRIEGYDIAHISGTSMVGVMVVIENGMPNKSEYRKFKIKTVDGADDTKALKEVLERRLGHSEWPLPALFVVDGGKAQINVFERVLKENGIKIPVVGVVKDERHRPKNIIGSKTLKFKYEKEILLADAEAHRFAISYHRKLSRKDLTKNKQ